MKFEARDLRRALRHVGTASFAIRAATGIETVDDAGDEAARCILESLKTQENQLTALIEACEKADCDGQRLTNRS